MSALNQVTQPDFKRGDDDRMFINNFIKFIINYLLQYLFENSNQAFKII
jgi:hypothetical protein